MKFLKLKGLLLLINFNRLNIIDKTFIVGRPEKINKFFISLFFLISNGKVFKKIFILNFFLNFKIGEMLLNRSKFSYLKKNKKTIKR